MVPDLLLFLIKSKLYVVFVSNWGFLEPQKPQDHLGWLLLLLNSGMNFLQRNQNYSVAENFTNSKFIFYGHQKLEVELPFFGGLALKNHALIGDHAN